MTRQKVLLINHCVLQAFFCKPMTCMLLNVFYSPTTWSFDARSGILYSARLLYYLKPCTTKSLCIHHTSFTYIYKKVLSTKPQNALTITVQYLRSVSIRMASWSVKGDFFVFNAGED